MKEYAFDVALGAVVRVTAETEDEAREAMGDVLNACSPSDAFLDGYNSAKGTVRITEFSLNYDGVYIQGGTLFEIDGEEVEVCQ